MNKTLSYYAFEKKTKLNADTLPDSIKSEIDKLDAIVDDYNNQVDADADAEELEAIEQKMNNLSDEIVASIKAHQAEEAANKKAQEEEAKKQAEVKKAEEEKAAKAKADAEANPKPQTPNPKTKPEDNPAPAPIPKPKVEVSTNSSSSAKGSGWGPLDDFMDY
jgi:regulator of protease activity HflC (stomatin/prohibitin superfamily)